MAIYSIAALLLLASLAVAQKDNGEECDCFRTNGSSAGYFTYHQFHDYRNIDTASATAPPIIQNAMDNTNAIATSDFFTSDVFAKDWTMASWNNSGTLGSGSSDASVLMINSPNNVYIEKSNDSSPSYSSYLTLRTARQPTFQTTAEIDSIPQNYHYLSARFLARIIGSPGACAGMFTYLQGDKPQDVQEADIEILTSGPRNVVQYTNQPSNDANGNAVPDATVNSTNPGARDWTQWMVYRVDWMPGKTTWYVDGETVAEISFQAPKDPAGLIVNMWSDGGSWTGNMSDYDQAYLQIQWIEVAFNTSGPVSGKRDVLGAGGALQRRDGDKGCAAVCAVDEQVNVTGTPALLYNNTGAAAAVDVGGLTGWKTWILVAISGIRIFGFL